MNPAIATLAEGYADRPREDRPWANFAYVDEDYVYRLRVMKPDDVGPYINREWDRWIPTAVDFG